MNTYEKYLTMAQEDPARAYKALAKVSDQRLVSLEHAREKEGTKSATNYAYKWAMREMKSLYGEGSTRFNRSIKPSELLDSQGKQVDINKVYQARINAMLTFISLPTSTIGGLRQTYQKIADSLNKNYPDLGFNFNVDNIGDFFESEAYEELEDFSSNTVLDSIATFKKNENEIAEKIRDYAISHLQNSEDKEVTEEEIKDFFENGNFSDFTLDIGANAKDEKVITDMVRKLGVRSLNDMYKGFGL